MISFHNNKLVLVGPKGTLPLICDDEITRKIGMLFEGECEGVSKTEVSKKFGYTRQRYYQLLQLFKTYGAEVLKSKKTGPQSNYRKTDELIRQVIRHRFLDPDASPEVIAQKLIQCNYQISIRSVERVITQYGLQKKTIHLPSPKRTHKD